MINRKEGSLFHYIKMDFYRAFISPNMIVGILGVFGTMWLAMAEGRSFSQGVLSVYVSILYSMPFMLTLIFSAFPYAGCFCEDYENKYIYLEIIRGELAKYTLSKVITILLSSSVAIVAGSLLYVLSACCFAPLVVIEFGDYSSLITEKSGFFLRQGHYLLYFVLCGFHFSIIASVLALLASYISLYISNKLLVFSVPIVSFYFIDYFIQNFFGIYAPRLHSFFVTPYSPFDSMSFLYAAIIGITCSILLYSMIYMKLKRRIQSE